MTTTDLAGDIWKWCQDAYLRHGGIKLTIPSNTPFHNTYQYRYAGLMAKRFTEWGFDEPASRRFIEMAAEYAREKKLIHKGLSVLCQSNMMNVMYEKLLQESDQSTYVISSLAGIHSWITDRSGKRKPVDVMLSRETPDANCNLIKWYGERRVNDLYLSLSASCGNALSILTKRYPSERLEVPSQARLYLTRLQFSKNKTNIAAAKRIFQGDWRQCP